MKKIILVWLCISCSLLAIGQRQITGTVTDSKTGAALQGVSVTVSGTNTIVTTNDAGIYNIPVPSNGSIVFTMVDYEDYIVTPGSSSTLNINMKVKTNLLQEVVITGYTSQTRKQSVSSITKISGETVKAQPIGSFEQLIQGRTPGTLIQSQSGQPGSAASVTIRGKGSVLGSTEPLYIVDGVQITGSDFQSINPGDIETYNILKDAVGTSQYGSRGANGVIVITTKRGGNQKTRINYDVQYGRGQLPENRLTLMSSAEKINYEFNYDRPDGTNPFGWTPEEADSLSKVNGTAALTDALFRKATTVQHQLSVTGGNERTRFFASGSIFNQEGVVVTTGLKRVTGRINVDHNVNNFKIGFNAFVGSSEFNNTNENDEFIGSPLNALRWANPYVTPFLPSGAYNEIDLQLQGQPNAMKELVENPVSNKQLKLIGSMSFEYRFRNIKGLSARSNLGIDFTDNENQQYFDRSTYQGSQQTGSQGSFGQNNTKNIRSTITNSLNYSKKIKQHNFNIALFNEIIKRKFKGFGYTGYGLVGPIKNGAGITPGTSTNGFIPTVNSNETETAITSVFAIGDYGFKNKYFLSASVRRDGSSRLADENKWTTFGAVGVSWLLSSEEFIKRLRVVDDLKLKVSYGSSANQGVGDDYEAKEQFGPVSYNGVGGLILTNLKKGNLTWEVRKTFNAGIDFALLKSKITGSVEFYNAVTNGLYLNRQISGTNGANSILTNLGKLRNRGVEISLNLTPVRRRNFTWSIGGNFTYNNNRILQLDGTNENINGISINRVGESANSILLVQYAGVNAATGEALYYTKDGKTTTNQYDPNDKVITGRFDPPYFGGLQSALEIRGIEISALFTYSFGNKVYNRDRVNVENPAYYVSNLSDEMLTEWQQPGDVTNIPSPFNDFQPNTTRFLEDGKFIRLRNVTLSYSFPQPMLDKAKIQSLKFFVQGQNLYVWSKFRGYDPEIATGALVGAQYPALRTITFGMNLGF